jgi:uncharacterized membrane protein YczE
MALNKKFLAQLLWFYLGLVVMSLGYALIIQPGLGAAPWDILHLGLAGRTGISLAIMVQLVGITIILLNWALGIRPTIGMFLNMLSCGPILQFFLDRIAPPEALLARWLMLAVGIAVTGFGIALYTSADMGAGPRDGMMLGFSRRFGLPAGTMKNIIDILVALIGWWLGGPLGIGTIAVALGLGPCMQVGSLLIARVAAYRPFSGFVRPVLLQRN